MWISVGTFSALILMTVGSSSKSSRCPSNDFECENGRCILLSWHCDHRNDCGDNSDEKDCPTTERCTEDQVVCLNGECISILWRCDGERDCADGSDELNCKETVCRDAQFRCDNGQCIPEAWTCDGSYDCFDKLDEKNCGARTCTDHEFRCESDGSCLDEVLRCNGRAECNDESDEKNCQHSCSEMKCSQKCRNTTFGPRCYCNDGFELDGRDNQTCIDIKDAELIFYNVEYRVYIIKRKEGNEKLDLLPDFQRAITGLSFQPQTEILYIADEVPSIYAVNLSSLHVRTLVKNNLSSPKDVIFDWMSNNLYWIDTDKGTIEVISVNTLKRIVLIDDLTKPVSLAISPYRGNMFVFETGLKACVSMYGMDGTDRRILHYVQGWPMSLALHPSETLLYWSDPRQEAISYVNYTSESPSRILMRGITGVMSVAASEDRIFYTADETPLQVNRKRSYHGKVHEIKLLESGKDKGWKNIAYSHGMKPSGKSECLTENGGCSYLCLTSPNGRTCACSTELTLDKDGKTCLGKQCEKNSFRCTDGQCIPANTKCNENIDCNDGSDEQDCEKV